MSIQKRVVTAKKRKTAAKIVIDESKGLVFASEQDLYRHFNDQIEELEQDFFRLRSRGDVPESEFAKYEGNLTPLLEDPDEVWEDQKTLKDHPLIIYLRKMNSDENGDEDPLYHVAVCYMTNDVPSFVYLHFPTHDVDLIEKYRRGVRIYDRSLRDVPIGAMEGDSLNEGDHLASGLYMAMLKLRSERDIVEEDFPDFFELREETLEEADEIWRSSDSLGNVLVTFVKEFPDFGDDGVHYVAVTLEDAVSNSHALLFSFPTRDRNLLERYRHGDNLQAEEVVQEASH
ncbi:MAG: peptidase [Bdellovibrionales bacterium]|nr:peptidase [Bdellovibrionales bacterium]